MLDGFYYDDYILFKIGGIDKRPTDEELDKMLNTMEKGQRLYVVNNSTGQVIYDKIRE